MTKNTWRSFVLVIQPTAELQPELSWHQHRQKRPGPKTKLKLQWPVYVGSSIKFLRCTPQKKSRARSCMNSHVVVKRLNVSRFESAFTSSQRSNLVDS